MATFITGQSGKVVVGTTTLNVESWSFNPEVDTPETTNTGSGGYEEHIVGIKRATGEFKADWDVDAVPTDSPPNLNIGESIALKLYMQADGDYINIPKATVVSLPIVSEVKGKVSYTCNFKVNGSWTTVTA